MAWLIAAPAMLLAAALVPVPVVAQPGADALPPDIVAAIRRQHAAPDDDTRYLDATIDLNGDGRPERLVHVVGPAACGTGGCPTLVFSPERSGHRLVSTISVTQPPIRVGRGRVNGWRNLIVRVGGGGTRERDVALAFDGKRYPGNATVKGSSVSAGRARNAQVLIGASATAAIAKLLPRSGGAAPAVLAGATLPPAAAALRPAAGAASSPVAAAASRPVAAAASRPVAAAASRPVAAAASRPVAAAASRPVAAVASSPVIAPAPSAAVAVAPSSAATGGASFDCASASTRVERAICSDSSLAALDRRMGDAFDKAMRDWPPDERAAQRTTQRNWIARLNACAASRTPRPCFESSYRQRLIEVQIQSGQLEAVKPVGFLCKGHENEPMTAAYYNQTDPKSALITFGKRQAIAFIAPSASGARYLGDDLEFWEHQGEALVTWSGKPYGCKVR